MPRMNEQDQIELDDQRFHYRIENPIDHTPHGFDKTKQCPGSEGLVRKFYSKNVADLPRFTPPSSAGSRYVACAECLGNVTDPNDLFGDWVGMSMPFHHRPIEPGSRSQTF